MIVETGKSKVKWPQASVWVFMETNHHQTIALGLTISAWGRTLLWIISAPISPLGWPRPSQRCAIVRISSIPFWFYRVRPTSGSPGPPVLPAPLPAWGLVALLTLFLGSFPQKSQVTSSLRRSRAPLLWWPRNYYEGRVMNDRKRGSRPQWHNPGHPSFFR